MIIKGKARGAPGQLGPYLLRGEENERVQVFGVRGTLAEDVPGAIDEMAAHAAGTRCKRSLYHAQISPQPPHRLTPEQIEQAVDALERRLGFEGHARVVVLHEKEGREHIHVVWSRIDLDRMRAVSDSHNYRAHEEVSRELERLFGHDRIQGAHAEREGVERPDRTPARWEVDQEQRTGIKGKDVAAEVTGLIRASDNAGAFKAALEERGYILARGDRRDFMIIDPEGGEHSLGRRIEGMKAAELRAFMKSIDRQSLPSLDEAKQLYQERRERSDLHDRDAAHRNWDARVGDAGIASGERKNALGRLARAARADDFTLRGQENAEFWKEFRERRDEALARGNEGWRRRADTPPPEIGTASKEQTALQIADGVSRIAGKLADFAASLLTGDRAPEPPSPEMRAAMQTLANERANAALGRIRGHIEKGEALQVEDLRSLTPSHLENIRAKGDAYVFELVSQLEAGRSRERGSGRERG